MEDLQAWQYALIALLFVWGGFVRSALGFGGAVLALPFLLMVHNEPLVFLPIIAVHLLFFSFITVVQSHLKVKREARHEGGGAVDWHFLRYALVLMVIPKLIGVAGVITLPSYIVSGFIFLVVAVYGASYLLHRPFRSNSRALDAFFLVLGGYVSGTSLVAAPLVVPVAASRVPMHQLRDTLFVLWFVLVALKLAAFVVAGIDLQWRHHLWLLPCAAVGHVIGLRFHRYALQSDTSLFFRVLGGGLLAVSLVGLLRTVLVGAPQE
jgi:uncharacterized membrane protein YfcA